MDPVTIIAGITALATGIKGLVAAGKALFASGEISADEMKAIEEAGNVTDSEWDIAQAAARARLGQ